ncbi:MAG: family 16 glycoside hydrolase [Candidatus Promineifilaceae bacterium]
MRRPPAGALAGLALLVAGLYLVACGPERGPGAAAVEGDFVETFAAGQSGNWHTEADDLGLSAIEGEQLVIEVHAPNTLQYASLREPLFSDFTLEVDASLLNGALENSFGVLFRQQGPVAFYRFEITGDGRFIVERHDPDGGWTRFLDDWQGSAAILTGVGAVNRLQVAAEGGQLTFYVNGTQLHRLTDATYAAGTIALDAGTFGQPPLRVSFDNLVVREP